jgi:hypothetical protein
VTRGAGALRFAIVACGAAGCGQNTIIIANFSDASVAPPLACTTSDAGSTCPTGQFCETSTCGSNEGLCQEVHAEKCQNDTTYGAQCDCDGISYFNQCLRRAASKSPSNADFPCDSQSGPHKGCAPAQECPAESACAFVITSLDPRLAFFVGDASADFTSACVAAPPAADSLDKVIGNCWVLPPTCPTSTGTKLRSCKGCKDACSAIRAGGPLISCDPDASDD